MKIGRYEYEIKKGDTFLDNGKCIQLITQSKEKPSWGISPSPVLSKKAIKELKSMDYCEKQYLETDAVIYVIN